MARSLFGAGALTEEARRTFAFVMIPFGATTADYFALVFIRHQERFSET